MKAPTVAAVVADFYPDIAEGLFGIVPRRVGKAWRDFGAD